MFLHDVVQDIRDLWVRLQKVQIYWHWTEMLYFLQYKPNEYKKKKYTVHIITSKFICFNKF